MIAAGADLARVVLSSIPHVRSVHLLQPMEEPVALERRLMAARVVTEARVAVRDHRVLLLPVQQLLAKSVQRFRLVNLRFPAFVPRPALQLVSEHRIHGSFVVLEVLQVRYGGAAAVSLVSWQLAQKMEKP